MKIACPMLALLLATAAPLAFAADNGMYPHVQLEYSAVAQYDYNRSTGQPKVTTTDGYLDITSVVHFRFSNDSQIWLGTEINPVVDIQPGQKRWLEGMGMTVTDLNFYHEGYNTAYRIGKYQVPFGRAMDQAPGLYTQDFVSAYDLGGMIGATFEYRYSNDRVGVIAPSVSTYFADTSFFSRNYFRPSPQARISDGGPANTGSLDSYAVVVNWLAPPAIPFLETQIGYMSNRKGVPVASDPPTPPSTPADEKISTLSFRYVLPLTTSTDLAPTLSGNYLDVVPFVEYVNVDNENGILGNDTSYLTTSLTVDHGRWIYGLTRTHKRLNPSGGSRSTEYIAEFSMTYHLTGLLDVGVSAGREKQGGSSSNLVGLAFTYSGAY